MKSLPPPPIELDAGLDEPVRLTCDPTSLVAQFQGPTGVTHEAAVRLVGEALVRPADGPPLAAHIVPGDRIVLAVADRLPQDQDVLEAVIGCLSDAGADTSVIEVLRPWSGRLEPVTAGVTTSIFNPEHENDTAYLAADEKADPLYMARALVDADVVVSIGSFGWNAALGGMATEGELWPVFSRREASDQLMRALAMRPRAAHRAWRSTARDVLWQMGVIAELRLVAGHGSSLVEAAFGLPTAAASTVRKAAYAWRPAITKAASLTIASLSDPLAGLDSLARAVAAASRTTFLDGTVCVVGRLSAEPGVVFSRWRQGVDLQPLIREAVRSREAALVADALFTRQIARALGARRLVLLSDLLESTLDGLDIGYASSPEDVDRLCHAAESVIVLHEADRMLPRLV